MNVLGVIELNSVADGLMTLDSMIKAAPVSVLKAYTVNPGKYIIIIQGDVASVEYAMKSGLESGRRSLVDQLFLANADPRIIAVLMENKKSSSFDSIGILETLSVTACIEAADKAVKTAEVHILEIQTGNDMGGRAALKISGSLGDIKDAMDVIVSNANGKGQLFRDVIIPGPHREIEGFVYGN